ncbi:hypothetical protein M3650_03655 [Paenibacillus sp. MER TA 81-3]|uniref:hypothetical protein n=1 Tax=Paenibacillus sp. MER TA 81-3 TaxID=2939573 RepID=UPI00203AFE7F|nr:hypothetical protein [Paenibacillus sp. MER TA 81-3]MCM3337755.1 hypothetical protein [Paenibacillus sp. MER TA 81-3]
MRSEEVKAAQEDGRGSSDTVRHCEPFPDNILDFIQISERSDLIDAPLMLLGMQLATIQCKNFRKKTGAMIYDATCFSSAEIIEGSQVF